MKQTNPFRRRVSALLPALAFLSVLTLAGTAHARQWTTSTNGPDNISHATGNVGVGTQSPAHGLHVEGASTATNNFIQGFFRNTNAALPYGGVGVDGQSQSHVRFMLGGALKWQWRVGGGAGTDDLRAFNWALGRDVLTLTNGGNVGVGTLTPSAALHVHNDSGVGTARVSGKNGGFMNFVDTEMPANQRLYQWRSEGGLFRMALTDETTGGTFVRQNILVANLSGNVGFGTAAPSTALEVGGGGTISLSGGAGAGQGNIRFGAAPSALYDTNLIHLNSNAGTTGIIAGSTPGYMAANGPYVAMRGNSYAVAPQRGLLAFSAGNVASPQGREGGISFLTGADQLRLFVSPGGSVGIGTDAPGSQYKLDVAGSVRVTADLSVTGTITGGTIQATYQDVAEWVPTVQKLRAGTVVVLDTGRSNHVVASGAAYDTKVAGVVSDEPGVILGVPGDDKVKVATTGRVKVKVDASRAPVKVGDLLVTSGVEGVAMKSVPVDLGGVAIHRPGTIIGKALEPLEKGVGEILVLLSMQ